MPGQIKVDFNSLSELQSQVNSSAQKILTEIEDIKRTVNGTHSYWSGAAQEQFGVRYQQLETAQKNVQEAISQFGGLIGRANQAYGDAETKIGSMFQGS
ncbi:MAG TPA: WXG100 family type VII secretion target [Mycobacteriales bacterium]|jgi:early secretory antigenic target protein ESAT-6|nr:WXG100 family type VII secretion target [Mycobacteriales bacterium]